MLVVIYAVNKNFFVNNICFVLIFTFFAVISNVCHKFSHMRDCERNKVITFFQKTGILCSHEHHRIHHKLSNEKYCVITEYNNYILDNINFWRILENIIYFITSIKPNRKPAYDDYYEIHNYMHDNAKLECPKTPTNEDLLILQKKLDKYKNCNNLKF